MKLKMGGKILLIAAIAGGGTYGLHYAADQGYFNAKPTIAAAVPQKIDLPTAPAAAPTPYPNPSLGAQTAPTRPSAVPSVPTFAAAPAVAPSNGNYDVHVQVLAWNATMGLHYANGGVTTASGSLMAKHGVRVTLERQDDYSQMIASMATFAKQLSDGNKNPTDGSAFVVIMGDAYPNFSHGLNTALAPYGQAGEAVGMIGFSRGEDACMLPAEVKGNPQKARGSLIGGVLRDGDVHICFKWASDNDIPINPDEKTYDPDAMNFVAVDDFTKADEKLIAGYCETRPIVKNGKPTGQKQNVCQNGTATWTPGDVKIAREKGGLAKVASTREYSYQMPALIIGNKQWMAANPALTANFLLAAFEGGDLVRSDASALAKGAAVEAAVFKEEDASYWAKYYQGVSEKDRTGYELPLGGSITAGLADNVFYFGLNGNDNIYKRVYTVYGGLDHTYYPSDLPDIFPYESVVNVGYVQALAAKVTVMAEAQKPVYSPTAKGTVVAKKAWHIEFETGKATFSTTAMDTLDDLLNQIAVSNLVVQINGHTDNTGSSPINLVLSKQRADAVKSWLVANASSGFPPERVRTRGYGDTQPIADNKTADGRTKNRRVEITLLSTDE